MLVLTLLVEDGNNHPMERGAKADPSPFTGACLARKVSSKVVSTKAPPSSQLNLSYLVCVLASK